MKKFFALAFAILFAVTGIFAQVKTGIVGEFDNKIPAIKMENNLAVATFKLKASDQQIVFIKNTAAKFASFSTFEFSNTKDDNGYFKVTVKSKPHKDTDSDKQYLLKLLYDFNLDNFIYNGQSYKVDQFPAIVK